MNTFMNRVNAIVQKNQMSSPEPIYPDAGMGALENVVSGVPRQAELMNQPHMLAYINPQEEQMLRDAGGAGIPGPDGIPVYGWWSDTLSEITSGGTAETATYNSPSDNNDSVVDTSNDTPSYVATADSTSFKATPKPTIGAVSSTGQYAGDGFEWVSQGTNENGSQMLTRTYTGANEGLTGSYDTPTGFDNPNVQQKYTGQPAVNNFVDSTPAPTSSIFTGGGADDVGNFGAVGDYLGRFGDTLGATNYGTQKIKERKYKPRTFTKEEVDKFTTKNTGRENLADFLTPFDNAKYYGGNLLTEISPGVYQDLTGGGFTTNKAGYKDRIYGVADDFSNNAPMVQGDMSDQDFKTAVLRQKLLESKPPSQGDYFGSFALDLLSPIPGLNIGGMAINPGIDRRQEGIDAQLDAIQAGSIPEYDEGKNYIGYRDKEGGALIRYNPNPQAPKPASQASYGSLNVGPEQTNEDAAPVVYSSQKAKNVYNRYYKGGSGFAMPFWLRRYASGNVINKDLARVTKDGVDYYQDQTGTLIPTSELPGLKMVAN